MIGCTQERKEAEAAAQATKEESIRKTEERLALRQQQATKEAMERGEEAQSLAEEASERETEAGGEPATALPTPTTRKEDSSATHVGEHSPDVVDGESAVMPVATAKPSAGTMSTAPGNDSDSQGTSGEQRGAVAAEDVAVATTPGRTAGAVGEGLSAILEEALEGPEDGLEAASGEKEGGDGDNGEDSKLHENAQAEREGVDKATKKHPSNVVTTQDPPPARPAETKPSEGAVGFAHDAAAPLGEFALPGNSDGTASVFPSAPGSGVGFGEGGGGGSSSSRVRGTNSNTARVQLAKQRTDIALLVDQAKEGMGYIKQSVDMADVLRGFVFTRHGIPVRDTAVGQKLLREGRSTLRERCRFSLGPLSLPLRLSLTRSEGSLSTERKAARE